MGSVCSICRHEKTEAISLELLQKVPVRDIAAKYGVSTSALQRHKGHIPKVLAVAEQAQHVAEASSVMQKIIELDRRADEIYKEAKEGEDLALALKALKELRETAALFAKVTGELQQQTVHQHLHITPEWLTLRAQILAALAPYPEARAAIVKALGGATLD